MYKYKVLVTCAKMEICIDSPPPLLLYYSHPHTHPKLTGSNTPEENINNIIKAAFRFGLSFFSRFSQPIYVRMVKLSNVHVFHLFYFQSHYFDFYCRRIFDGVKSRSRDEFDSSFFFLLYRLIADTTLTIAMQCNAIRRNVDTNGNGHSIFILISHCKRIAYVRKSGIPFGPFRCLKYVFFD